MKKSKEQELKICKLTDENMDQWESMLTKQFKASDSNTLNISLDISERNINKAIVLFGTFRPSKGKTKKDEKFSLYVHDFSIRTEWHLDVNRKKYEKRNNRYYFKKLSALYDKEFDREKYNTKQYFSKIERDFETGNKYYYYELYFCETPNTPLKDREIIDYANLNLKTDDGKRISATKIGKYHRITTSQKLWKDFSSSVKGNPHLSEVKIHSKLEYLNEDIGKGYLKKIQAEQYEQTSIKNLEKQQALIKKGGLSFIRLDKLNYAAMLPRYTDVITEDTKNPFSCVKTLEIRDLDQSCGKMLSDGTENLGKVFQCIENINVCDSDITSEMIDALCAAVRQAKDSHKLSLKTINFRNCNITEEALKSLLIIARDNPDITLMVDETITINDTTCIISNLTPDGLDPKPESQRIQTPTANLLAHILTKKPLLQSLTIKDKSLTSEQIATIINANSKNENFHTLSVHAELLSKLLKSQKFLIVSAKGRREEWRKSLIIDEKVASKITSFAITDDFVTQDMLDNIFPRIIEQLPNLSNIEITNSTIKSSNVRALIDTLGQKSGDDSQKTYSFNLSNSHLSLTTLYELVNCGNVNGINIKDCKFTDTEDDVSKDPVKYYEMMMFLLNSPKMNFDHEQLSQMTKKLFSSCKKKEKEIDFHLVNTCNNIVEALFAKIYNYEYPVGDIFYTASHLINELAPILNEEQQTGVCVFYLHKLNQLYSYWFIENANPRYTTIQRNILREMKDFMKTMSKLQILHLADPQQIISACDIYVNFHFNSLYEYGTPTLPEYVEAFKRLQRDLGNIPQYKETPSYQQLHANFVDACTQKSQTVFRQDQDLDAIIEILQQPPPHITPQTLAPISEPSVPSAPPMVELNLEKSESVLLTLYKKKAYYLLGNYIHEYNQDIRNKKGNFAINQQKCQFLKKVQRSLKTINKFSDLNDALEAVSKKTFSVAWIPVKGLTRVTDGLRPLQAQIKDIISGEIYKITEEGFLLIADEAVAEPALTQTASSSSTESLFYVPPAADFPAPSAPPLADVSLNTFDAYLNLGRSVSSGVATSLHDVLASSTPSSTAQQQSSDSSSSRSPSSPGTTPAALFSTLPSESPPKQPAPMTQKQREQRAAEKLEQQLPNVPTHTLPHPTQENELSSKKNKDNKQSPSTKTPG